MLQHVVLVGIFLIKQSYNFFFYKFSDVSDIKYVINYDYPKSSEDYIHRIGRTGRCNQKVL